VNEEKRGDNNHRSAVGDFSLVLNLLCTEGNDNYKRVKSPTACVWKYFKKPVNLTVHETERPSTITKLAKQKRTKGGNFGHFMPQFYATPCYARVNHHPNLQNLKDFLPCSPPVFKSPPQ
jgi:hypothetical protein